MAKRRHHNYPFVTVDQHSDGGEHDYEAHSAMQTIARANEHMKDKALMARVKKRAALEVEKSRHVADQVQQQGNASMAKKQKPFKLNPKKKGMWKGKSEEEIEAAKSAAKRDGNVTREREANFAIEAKQGKFRGKKKKKHREPARTSGRRSWDQFGQ